MTQAPSGTRQWKWGNSLRAESKRWMNVIAPTLVSSTPASPKVRLTLHLIWRISDSMNTFSTSAHSRLSNPTAIRRPKGNAQTHCRYLASTGKTASTKCAATSDIRRPQHDGQNPLFLHEKPMTILWPHRRHANRASPCSRIPHLMYDSNSRTTNRGSPPASSARPLNSGQYSSTI
jgi:hypothetical protein